jgi:Na+:H+ antiporter, NhaA family
MPASRWAGAPWATPPARVAAGVLVGLVVGKPLGITAAAWLAVRLRLARLPDGAGWPGIAGVGALAGIGFTVSLFVTGLAFDDIVRQDEAKIGILAASTIAAVLGSVVLARATRPAPAPDRDTSPSAAPS